ncbi:MAG: DUF4365 domain-containing protein [Kiritimatiellae bacterium]|nr:DUF4365 domain-containing protein [Kiritimatiellia bacterium]
MAKIINDNQMLGEMGETFIRSLVLKMGYTFEGIKTDAGIDGTIEIRDPASGKMLNLILRVQVKATRAFQNETDDQFLFRCDKNDVEYWLKGNTPNILVVCNPMTEKAYWISIRNYFSLLKPSSFTVKFHKKEDVFDETTAGKLLEIARPVDSGLYMEAPRKNDVLTSNLLVVKRLPEIVYVAPTTCRSLGEVYAKGKEAGCSLPPEIIYHEKMLTSVHDFREDNVWNSVCESSGSDAFSFDDRFDMIEDVLNRRLASEFLFNCLKGFSANCGLQYLHREGLFYVKYAKIDGAAQKRGFHSSSRLSVRQGKRGMVVPLRGRAKGFKHCAFFAKVLLIEESWYLQIEPTYHYTYDGFKPKHNAAEFLSKIKRLEKNMSVFSQLRMWEQFLSESGEPDLLSAGYGHLGFGRLEYFNLDRSVPDALWRSKAGAMDDGTDEEFWE